MWARRETRSAGKPFACDPYLGERENYRGGRADVGVGLVMAAGMSRLVRGMLYGIAPLDPPTYAAAAWVIIAIAIAACGLPAWRAARTDVLRVLRAD